MRLVSSVMAVKNKLEINAMREAMAVADVAVRAFQQSRRDGIAEAEMAATVNGEVRKACGDEVRLVSIGFAGSLFLSAIRLRVRPVWPSESRFPYRSLNRRICQISAG
ncbi:hypothetical protein ACVIHI_008412 [Bradyrhizobium sp. USDA 4524]|uniref:hypothetical protein n=1 Tax=unclassified Bradyrhizobium TaxID=2631580 RepID=UPI00209C7312|nr:MULTISPECIES: hypothetical protein [unclassified Bradyrhizobium]MCP1838661.1 hypothetical protein [Bradyrhizobium sp. USDA 4538]MCP1899227.1 hypothetical protein [Bradyrhizobium sp. USDA 4537]MCP1986661.1 hypothetical protein [Bradyrhizobium sp. USDA 4539]